MPLCADVDAWGTAVGDVVWVNQCKMESDPTHMKNRRWVFDSATSGKLRNPASNLCLSLEPGQVLTGDR